MDNTEQKEERDTECGVKTDFYSTFMDSLSTMLGEHTDLVLVIHMGYKFKPKKIQHFFRAV